ncbi:MAG: hypothetical protein IKQ83_08720 [Lachnospiraceae bacterium]|nr:hypothetical protein [Lachnospiraceae bacterium]
MNFMMPVSLSFVDTLEDLLEDIFNEILVPILVKAFYFLWDLVGGMIMSAINHALFMGFATLCKIVLIVERIFDVFSCTTGVYVLQGSEYVATSGYDVAHNNSLLDVLMQRDYIVNAVLMMTAGAFALCFLVTIFAVVKSMGEGLGELKRPVTHVIRQTFKACFTFAIIPLACIFVVKLAGVVICTIQVYMPNNIDGSNNESALTYVSEVISGDGTTPMRGTKQSQIERAIAAARSATPGATTTMADLIFFMSVKNALRNPANASYYASGQHFQNTLTAMQDIDLDKVEWLYAYVEVIMVLFILILLIVQCIVRIFMILILFVVSPYYVALIPLDDGAKFKRWKEMFVAFVIGIFGPIITMKTYLVILPYVVNGDNIDFGFSAATMELFKLFFIAAGAYAVFKSQNLMLEIINPEVAMFLGQPAQMVKSKIIGTVTGGATKAVGMVSKSAKGRIENSLGIIDPDAPAGGGK